jgi:DNA-binding LacI/PurR family transcriptional regulator
MATSKNVNKRRRAISMADVAKEAGVSQQTVSRVVNDQPKVSKKTRVQVQKAMDDLGFRPNFAGRSLRSGRYRSVGLCLYNITEFGNLSTLDGIMSAARAHGYAITMIEMGDDAPISLEQASQHMLELPVDGMIISMSIKASDFEKFKPNSGLNTVLLTMYAHPYCTTVDSDQYGCSTLVMDYLFTHGHRNIRFVAGPDYSVDSIFREKGWRDALLSKGLPLTEPLRGDWTADSGYEAGVQLAKDPELTAVYAANDQMALGAITALQDAGRRIPEDVSVVGVDDSLAETIAHVGLTTVRFNLIERGKSAFEHALLGSSPNYEVCQIRIPGTLIERTSVADIS